MIYSHWKFVKATIFICLLAGGLMLNGCGGSSGGSDTTAGIGGTGIAVGKITDFGSVFVNGDIFNTDTSQFIVDGDPNATQTDLAIGMVIIVKAETNNGIFTGKAIEVFYDDEVEGPVAATPVDVPGSNGTQKTFTVFGQTITIDETGTIFEGTTFAGLDVDDVVEISGFRASNTTIEATYVEFKGTLVPGTTEVELRGTISGYSMGPPETFVIDGVTITTDAMTEIDVAGGVLSDGLFVEVEGIIQPNSSVLAEKVEEEEEGFADDVDDVSLQGIISNYVSDADFEIDGQAIDASGAQISPAGVALGNGLEVEVEGEIVGGVLIAEEVEVREGETELQTTVSPGSVGATSFEVFYPAIAGTVVINVDAQTLFKDEAGANPLSNFSISDLNDNDFVKIEGQEINDEVVASIVKRVDPDDYKFEGAVDAFAFDSWIEILGLRYNVDGDTEYEDNSMTSAVFFGLLQVGDLVEIEDGQAPLGVADEVEFD